MSREHQHVGSGDHMVWWNRWGKLHRVLGSGSDGHSEEREELWSGVTGGEILEIGVGAGASFPYHPPNSSVTAVDISEAMLETAREQAAEEGVNVDLYQMNLEDMSFDANAFDYAVSNATLCCTEDVHSAVDELARVLKPDGRFVMLENVRPETSWLARLFDYLKPVAHCLHGGYFYRDTPAILREHGFTIEQIKTKDDHGMRKFIIAVPGK